MVQEIADGTLLAEGDELTQELLRKGGSNRVLTSSTKRHQDGVPVSLSRRWYHSWAEPVMWSVANQTLSSSMVC